VKKYYFEYDMPIGYIADIKNEKGYPLNECIWDLFADAGNHLYSISPSDNYYQEEQEAYIRKALGLSKAEQELYASDIQDVIEDSLVSAYAFDLINEAHKDILNHVLKLKKDFQASAVSYYKNDKPCEYSECNYVTFQWTRKAFMPYIRDYAKDEHLSLREVEAEHRQDAFLYSAEYYDMKVYNWGFFDYYGTRGSSDDWKECIDLYPIQEKIRHRASRAKTLIQNRVQLGIKQSVLEVL